MLCRPVCGGITPAKEDIAILVENSVAMQQLDQNLVLPASIRLFVERITRDVRIALILFNESAILKAPFASATGDDTSSFMQALKGIDYSNQYANSAAALERALYELKNTRHRGAGKSIILIAQGSINTGNEKLDANFSRWLSDVLAIEAAEQHIRIFCIAVSPATEAGLLQDLAHKTGGVFYRATSADELQGIFTKLTNDMFYQPDPSLSGGTEGGQIQR